MKMHQWTVAKYLLIFTLIMASFNPVSAREVSILTWNIFGIPKPILWNQQEIRGKLIGQVLKNTNYDVILLQEAFSKNMRRHIYAALKDHFPYQTGLLQSKRFFAFFSSGVWFLSRWPMKVIDADFFKECTGMDCFASKAAQLVEISFSAKEKIQLMSTHMQAQRGKKNAAIRKTQLLQIDQLLKRNHQNNLVQILTGDLNIDTYNHDEYPFMEQILQIFDAPSTQGPKYSIGDPANRYTDDTQQLIDYNMVSLQDASQATVLQKEIIPFKAMHKGKLRDLSDHDALSVTYQIRF